MGRAQQRVTFLPSTNTNPGQGNGLVEVTDEGNPGQGSNPGQVSKEYTGQESLEEVTLVEQAILPIPVSTIAISMRAETILFLLGKVQIY